MQELKRVRSKVKANYNDTYVHLTDSNMPANQPEKEDWYEHEVDTSEEEATEGVSHHGAGGGGIMANLPPEIQQYVQAQIGNKQHQGMSPAPQGQVTQTANNGVGNIQDVIDNIFGKEGQGQSESTNNATQEQEQRGSESPQNDSGQQESQQGDKSCTAEERAFLDAFMALQEAGNLLGMVPASRTVAGTNLKNIKLVPVVNQIKPSDKQFVAEVQEEDSVYKLMDTPMKTMFQSLDKMLINKGIK